MLSQSAEIQEAEALGRSHGERGRVYNPPYSLINERLLVEAYERGYEMSADDRR